MHNADGAGSAKSGKQDITKGKIMAEWPEARKIAANYQSPGTTGIGFARFASSGTVTPELWDNIRSCEDKADELYAEGWAKDMAKLRELLAADGIVEQTETETEFTGQELVDALKAAGIEDVTCEETGGNTATIIIDKGIMMIGPGSFGGPAIFDSEDLSYGFYTIDENGDTWEDGSYTMIEPGTAVPDIARQIAEAYRAHKES